MEKSGMQSNYNTDIDLLIYEYLIVGDTALQQQKQNKVARLQTKK